MNFFGVFFFSRLLLTIHEDGISSFCVKLTVKMCDQLLQIMCEFVIV